MPEEQKDKQDRMIELLEELVKWTKVTNIPQVKKLLLELLQGDEQKIAYHNSNGNSSREVAEVAGASQTDVTKWWKVWIRAGIAEPLSVQRGDRAKRSFSLEDFGIEIPRMKEAKKEEKQVVEPTPSEKPEVSKQSQEESNA